MSVGPLVEIREKLRAETGAGWRRERATRDVREGGDQLAVPAAVIGADRLLDQRVGRVDREVGGGHQDNRSGAVVRGYWELVRLGHRRDLLRLGDTAAPGDVEHGDAHGAALERLAESPAGGDRLAQRHRDMSAGGEGGQGIEIV